ncbi:MAG: hypothetical protein ACKVG4_09060 [Longimicrobiales bacterium]
MCWRYCLSPKTMILYSVAAWPISGAAWLLAEDFFNVILPNVSIPCET